MHVVSFQDGLTVILVLAGQVPGATAKPLQKNLDNLDKNNQDGLELIHKNKGTTKESTVGTIIRTTDTEARISEPNLPADDRSGDGYDYIETAEKAGWTVVNVWGEDGWDFGAWPYVIGFVRAADNGNGGRRFGFGLYVEGDLKTDYYDSVEACTEAIDREAFWFWKSGQSDGPKDLPANFEDLDPKYRGVSKY